MCVCLCVCVCVLQSNGNKVEMLMPTSEEGLGLFTDTLCSFFSDFKLLKP